MYIINILLVTILPPMADPGGGGGRGTPPPPPNLRKKVHVKTRDFYLFGGLSPPPPWRSREGGGVQICNFSRTSHPPSVYKLVIRNDF